MNKKFLSIVVLVSAISLHGMDGNNTDKQLAFDTAALEIKNDMVDAWDALGKDKKKEVRSTLEKLAKKYNEYYATVDPERVLSEDQSKKAVKQAYIDIKIGIRRDGGTLPILPSDEAEKEKAEKAYYHEGFLRTAIQRVRYPGAVCAFNLKQDVVSDSEDEATDKK
jgi:hypothetical protein